VCPAWSSGEYSLPAGKTLKALTLQPLAVDTINQASLAQEIAAPVKNSYYLSKQIAHRANSFVNLCQPVNPPHTLCKLKGRKSSVALIHSKLGVL
jgi:hypothetical protein